MSLPFDTPVSPGGYAWWYMDALSDDGRYGITIIAFLGCVFSPSYHNARRDDRTADPFAASTINVAIYGPGVHTWVISRWPKATVRQAPDHLQLGGTTLAWRGDALEVRFDDRTTPWGTRTKGLLRIHPAARRTEVVTLEEAGRHLWYPMSPVARFEAEVEAPALRFSGTAYQDANSGDEGLEPALHSWTWVRQARPDGVAVLYDVDRVRTGGLKLSRLFHPNGGTEELETAGANQALPKGWWGVERSTRGEAPVNVLEDYEDSPFYTRSVIETTLGGYRGPALHEWADIDRFARPGVQLLLPYKFRGERLNPRALGRMLTGQPGWPDRPGG